MEKVIRVKIADLKNGFYVREKINDDHVYFLASLAEAGIKLPPIKIYEDGSINDGRHRVEMAKFLDWQEIDAIIVKDGHSPAQMVAMAIKSNLGGSLPPTKDDIIHSIIYLFENRTSKETILSHLSQSLPRSMVRVLVTKSFYILQRRNARRAANLVRETNCTIEDASRKCIPTTIKLIQEELGIGKITIPKYNAILANKFRLLNKGIGHTITKLAREYRDGEIKKDQVDDFLKLLGKEITNTNRLYINWQTRFSKI